MLVIADTSPLHYLILIGHIDVLPSLYDQIVIPAIVITELTRAQTPETVRLWIADRPDWLDVRQPQTAMPVTLSKVDDGERDALLLAMEREADLVLMDDLDGRAAATRHNLITTGTLGLLELASIRDLLDLPEALSRLLETNFRAPQEIIADLLARDAERRGET